MYISKVRLLIFAIVIAAIGIGAFFYQRNFTGDKKEREVADVLSKVGQLIDLPSDETPVIAIISDADKLKSEPIFAKALKGDYVLIYNKFGKIIIYRPFTNKIIETAPLSSIKTLPASNAPAQQIAPALDNVTIALYNGAATGSAILNDTEKKLKDNYPKIKIVAKEESSKKTYSRNLIIDTKGTKNNEVGELKKLLDADISSIPEGENPPGADILIIIVK